MTANPETAACAGSPSVACREASSAAAPPTQKIRPKAASSSAMARRGSPGRALRTKASPTMAASTAQDRIALTSVSSIDISVSMSVDLELAPKTRRPAGERCCEPVVYPDVEREHALRMATVAKALGDPIRLQLLDVLRKHAGKVCVCELVPLFDVAQPTLSHHLKKLREAGLVDSERQGLWAYYYVNTDALEELTAWLS